VGTGGRVAGGSEVKVGIAVSVLLTVVASMSDSWRAVLEGTEQATSPNPATIARKKAFIRIESESSLLT
jgi:hypothetical protein